MSDDARSVAPGSVSPYIPLEEPLSAIIIVHVVSRVEGKLREGERPKETPEEGIPLKIRKLGLRGEALSSLETSEHTVHVAPGRYEVWAVYEEWAKEVTVTEGQAAEVTIYLEGA